ncbi:hypothetical protein ACEVJL_10815 [Pseudoflavonifractor sp. P01025]|uniref:hypothetical protein n=1 Tax=Eubacteriales TaxID=186802 RepID=UPI001ADF8B23|nr:hypothetical protein [Flavonifractor sp. AGMB03687]
MRRKATVVGLCGLVLFIVVAYALGFNTTRLATRIGYTGHEWLDSWSGKYICLDGSMTKTIHTNSDQDAIHVEVVTESGNISITMTDSEGNTVFEEDDIETSEFNVDVSGSVKVRITADKHRGSFSVASE